MDSVNILASLCIILAAAYYYFTFWYGYWKKYGLPVPKGTLPGLGNMYPVLFMKKSVALLTKDIYNQMVGYSMVGLYNFRKPTLIVRDPDLVKTVMQSEFSAFHENLLSVDPELDPLLCTGPFFASGIQWKHSRKELSTAFTSGKLKYMYESIDNVCSKLVNYLNRKTANAGGESIEVEAKELFSRFTAEVVAVAAFGIEGESFKSEKDGMFRKMGRLMFEPSPLKGFKQFVGLTLPVFRKLFGISFMPIEVQTFFIKVVREVLQYRKENNVKKNDLLQLMLQYKESDELANNGSSGKFDDMSIASHTTAFFLDGYESTSIAISFFAYVLSQHPDVQQKVRDEVLNVAKKHNGITYDALQEMVYMEQAFNESMRLFPALGVLSKVCTEEIDIRGADGLTCRVIPGTTVLIPVFGLHMDSQYWPEPEKFDPDRFSEENKQGRHKYVYLPFGEGPRICIGMRMGVLQTKAAIATILQHFTLTLSPKTKEPLEINPNYFMTAALGGIWMDLKPL